MMMIFSRWKAFSYKTLVYSLIFSQIAQSVQGMEAAVHAVEPLPVVDILSRLDKPHYYDISLGEPFWVDPSPTPTYLREGDKILAGILYDSPSKTLIFQALYAGMEGVDREDLPEKPAHFHFHHGRGEEVFYGNARIESGGAVSLYPGLYRHLHLRARQVAFTSDSQSDVNLEPDVKRLTIKGSLLVDHNTRFNQKAPVSVGGGTQILTHKFNSQELFKTKRKGVICAREFSNLQELLFGGDTVISGPKEKPFKVFHNKGTVKSRENLTLHGKKFIQKVEEIVPQRGKKQEEKGVYARDSLQILLHHFEGNGIIKAPYLSINATHHLFLQKTHVEALSLYLTSPQIGFYDPKIEAQGGMCITASHADGNADFQIGRIQQKRHFKPLSVKKRLIPPLSGTYWNIAHLHLEEDSHVALCKGETSISSISAVIRGKIAAGNYNKDKIGVHAQDYLKIAGSWDAYQSYFSALKGELSGVFHIKDLSTTFTHLDIPGTIKTDFLQSIGTSLYISQSGKVEAAHHEFVHQSMSVAGQWRGTGCDGQAAHLGIGTTGQASFKHAHLETDNTTVSGSLTLDTLELHGNSFSLSPQGQIALGSVTNYTPVWSLAGKGSIHSFATNVPTFTLYGSSNVNIRNATLKGGVVNLSGHTNITHATIASGSVNVSGQTHINEATIMSDAAAFSGSSTIDYLTLSTGFWSLTSDAILEGNIHVKADSASLAGEVRGGYLSGWVGNCRVAPTGELQSDWTSLAGDSFTSHGAIHSSSGIQLDYTKYPSFGKLMTSGTLGMTLNDRQVDAELLHNFANQFCFSHLAFQTNQALTFEQDFSYNRGLALSASSIAFKGDNPHQRKQFWVAGPLQLESRSGDISAKHYDISAQKMDFESRGRISLHNTGLATEQQMDLNADQGINMTPEEIHHRTVHTKSTYAGLKREKTVREWNEVLRSSLHAEKGAINLKSLYGGAAFDSATVSGMEGVYADVQGDITNLERILYDYTVCKKRTPFSFSRYETRQEGDEPTIFTSFEDVQLKSQGGLRLPNTVFIASHVALEAVKDVYLSRPSLRFEFDRESVGLTFSHAGSGITDDPLRTLARLNSVTGALANVYDVRRQNALNQISAGVMAGIQGYNAYHGYLKALEKGGDLGSYLASDLLSNLMTVHVGFGASSADGYHTSAGQGGIFSQTARLRSHEGNIHTLNGFSLDATEELVISCPKGIWEKSGFKSIFGGSSTNLQMNVGVNLMTMTPSSVSFSGSSSDYEGTQWTPQSIHTKKLTVDAREVQTKDGENTFHKSESSFGFSLSQSGGNLTGGSFNINGTGISYRSPNSEDGPLGYIGFQVNGTNVVIPWGEINFQGTPPPPNVPVEKKAEEVVPPLTQSTQSTTTTNRTTEPTGESQQPQEKELSRPGSEPSDFLIMPDPFWDNNDEDLWAEPLRDPFTGILYPPPVSYEADKSVTQPAKPTQPASSSPSSSSILRTTEPTGESPQHGEEGSHPDADPEDLFLPLIPQHLFLEKWKDIETENIEIEEGKGSPPAQYNYYFRLEEEKGYVRSGWEGIKEEVLAFPAGMVSFAKSILDLGKDTLILYMGADDARRRREFGLDLEPSIPSIQDTVFHREASKRMKERKNVLGTTASYLGDYGYVMWKLIQKAGAVEIMPWLANETMDFEKTPDFQKACRGFTAPFAYQAELEARMSGPELTKAHTKRITGLLLPFAAPKAVSGVISGASKTFSMMRKAKVPRHKTPTPPVKDPKTGIWYSLEMNSRGYYSLGNTDHVLFQHMNRKKNAPFIVSGHGSRTHVEFPITERIVQPGAQPIIKTIKIQSLSPKELAAKVKQFPKYRQGDSVFLYACSTGRGRNPFAQGLANELNVPVFAPTGNVWKYKVLYTYISRFNKRWLDEIIKRHDSWVQKYMPFLCGEIKTFYPRQNVSTPALTKIIEEARSKLEKITALSLETFKGGAGAKTFAVNAKKFSPNTGIKSQSYKNLRPPVKDPKTGMWKVRNMEYSKRYSLDKSDPQWLLLEGMYEKKNAPFLVSGKINHMSPEELALTLRSIADSNKKPLFIFSDSAGKGRNSFAQGLADELKKPVFAPTGDILKYYYDSKIYVSRFNYAPLNKIIMRYDSWVQKYMPFLCGEIKTFYPRQKVGTPALPAIKRGAGTKPGKGNSSFRGARSSFRSQLQSMAASSLREIIEVTCSRLGKSVKVWKERFLFVKTPKDKPVHFHRYLGWEDVGVPKTSLHFDWRDRRLTNENFKAPPEAHILKGIITREGNVLLVRVVNVETSKNNIPQIITSLKELAQMSGAEKMILEGYIINPKLMKMIGKRYVIRTHECLTQIEFPIQPGTLNPTRLLLPAPKEIPPVGGNSSWVTVLKEKGF